MMAHTGDEAETLLLNFLVKRTGQDWEALCLELDIASCGRTEEEAVESLKGLIDLYVDDCIAAGEYPPLPKRPVTLEAIREFLSPPDDETEITLTSRLEPVPVHHAYS